MSLQAQIEKLVAKFEDSTIKQTEEIRNGDARAGNRYAKQRVAAFKKLRALGDLGRDALVPLLAHPRADVREIAAVYLLRHKTEEALKVLRQEARGVGLVAFGAQQAIKRWEEGTWSVDPP